MAWPTTVIVVEPIAVPYIFGSKVVADGEALYDEGYADGEEAGGQTDAPPTSGQIWPR